MAAPPVKALAGFDDEEFGAPIGPSARRLVHAALVRTELLKP